MAEQDARLTQDLDAFTAAVTQALGDDLVSLVLYGSATSDDWVAGVSDVNTAVVVRRVTTSALEALGTVFAARRPRFAAPLVIDREFLDRARDVFPIELDDIRRSHRVLVGEDVFAPLRIAPAALRAECEREARGKLLRLRAVFVETRGDARALEAGMLGSLKSTLILLRHLLALRGAHPGMQYAAVLAAGEQLLGPLPAMRALLEHRRRNAPDASAGAAALFGPYAAEVERVVAALDAIDA